MTDRVPPMAERLDDGAPGSRERGALLVELMVMMSSALLLLSGALLSVTSHSNQRRMHTERTLAMAACRNTFESMRSLDMATIRRLDGTGFDVPGLNGQLHGLTTRPGDHDGLAGNIRVKPYLTASAGDVYLVTLTVQWRGAAREADFVMESLIGARR